MLTYQLVFHTRYQRFPKEMNGLDIIQLTVSSCNMYINREGNFLRFFSFQCTQNSHDLQNDYRVELIRSPEMTNAPYKELQCSEDNTQHFVESSVYHYSKSSSKYYRYYRNKICLCLD